jgi:hypothetical protein
MNNHMSPGGKDALAQLAEILAVTDRRVEVRIYVRELPAVDVTDWPTEAKKIAQHLRRKSPGIENAELAPLVRTQLVAAGVLGRGGRPPSISSILRRGLGQNDVGESAIR